MADGTELNAGSGGDIIATDDVAGTKYQIVKVTIGADGVAGTLVTGNTGTVDAGTVRVTLATNVTPPLPSGASTSANQTSIITLLAGGLPAALGTGGGVKVDGSGTALPVSIATVPSHAVTNAGTFAVQVDGAALTSLQLIDDAVFTDDTTTHTPGTSKGLAVGGVVDDDSTDDADEGDVVLFRATKARRLRTVAALDSAAMQSGNDQVTPKFVPVAAASSGDNTLVSGVGSKKLRVLNYVLMASGTVNAKFQSSSGGDITGLLYLVVNTGASSGYAPTGHFETVAGEDLQLNLSGAVAVGGHLSYIEVD